MQTLGNATMINRIIPPLGGNRTRAMLYAFGVRLEVPGYPILVWRPESPPSIHHSQMPVAVVAHALIDGSYCRELFPKASLLHVVTKRPSMDGGEAIALGLVCGVDVSATMWPTSPAPAFAAHLRDLIDRRHVLNQFFGSFPDRAINGIDIRPLGVDHRSSEVNDAAMKVWRRNYSKLSSPHQMLVATILWLYTADNAKLWLNRLPCKWHTADAVFMLRKNGMLEDWAKLVALYPGW